MSASMLMTTGVALDAQIKYNEAKQLVTTMKNTDREFNSQMVNAEILSKTKENSNSTEAIAKASGEAIRASSEMIKAL